MKNLPLSLAAMKKYKMAEEISLGRGRENNIIIDDPAVSRLQAVIRREEDGVVIRNLGKNGFAVNHLPVTTKKHLDPGDLIDFPGCRILFLGNCMAVGLEKGELSGLHEISVEALTDDMRQKQEAGTYHRFPRSRIGTDLSPVEIDSPPSVTRPDIPSAWMLIGQNLMTAFPMLAGSVFMIYAFTLSMGKNDLTMYVGLVSTSLTVVFSVLWALISRTVEKSRARIEKKELVTAYRKYLTGCEKELKKRVKRCREILLERYPCADDCILLAGSGLWNRDPNHDDFLKHRIGAGDLPIPFEIRIPKETFHMDGAGMWKQLGAIREDYRVMHGVPVLLDFTSNEQVGIVGEDGETVHALIRALLVQLASSISYIDLKIAFIYDGKKQQDWDFLRWMPHTFSRGRRKRYLADNNARTRVLCEDLMERVRELRERNSETKSDPWLFLFVTDPDLIADEALYTYLSQADRLDKLRVVWAAEKREELPYSCACILEYGAGFQRTYAGKGQEVSEQKLIFDQVDQALTDSFMREISGFTLREPEGRDLPDVISFFEMMRIDDPRDLKIADLWRENDVGTSIHAMVGMKEGGRACYLDLHEKYHGPHGLIAGMTGSGKSEMIASLILSLSLSYSPQSLNFFLIDYKGGGMSTLFKGLPHICGEISNLSGNLVHRAMISIKSECTRRQRIFQRYHTLSINEYTRLFQEGQAGEPLPHLIIIIDEFAEMKREEPEFMKELISVAQVGRSLGVHLILSTQKPAGTVDENIWSNSRFRICLRVQDRQDSMDMLHTPDAASIRQIGRGYLQVGHNERYELFQSGWGNAPLRMTGRDTGAVARVHLDGRKETVFPESDTKEEKEEKTQLAYLVDLIRQTAREEGSHVPHDLWSDPLPSKLGALDEADDSSAAWVGVFDDPEEQTRHPFLVDIRQSGNIGIFGISASGKSCLISTLLYSTCRILTPAEIHLFILDAGGGALHALKGLPHVGDYLIPEEEEKCGRLFKRLEKELEARKRLLRGVNFTAYVKKGRKELPFIILVIDGFAAAMAKWDKTCEEKLMQILTYGSRHGIIVLMTASGLEGSAFLGQASGCFQTKIALTMKDRYSYGEIFGQLTLPVYPEKGIPGRGIARMGERILEFQTGLYFDAEDDLKRQEEMIKASEDYARTYQGPRPEETRVMPSRPGWKRFLTDASGLGFCCGYAVESARPLPLDPFFCLLVSGEAGRGREDAFDLLLAAAIEGGDSRVCCFDSENRFRDSPLKGRLFAHLTGQEELFSFFDKLTPVLEERKKGSTMESCRQYYIFIDDMLAFLLAVYEGDYEMSGFMENVFEKGDGCGISFIAAFRPEQRSLLDGYLAFRIFCSHETGIHMGGELIDHPFAGTLDLTAQEELVRLPARSGHYLRKDRRPEEILVPEMNLK